MPKNTTTSHSSELFGVSLKIFSGILFAIMFAIVKLVSNDMTLGQSMPLGQVVFFRSAIALIPLVIFLLMTSDFPSGLRTEYPLKHILRCGFGTLAMFLAFATIRFLPLAETTALSYMSPVILVFFALFFFGEKVSIRRWWGVVFGLSGLAVMTLPSFSASASQDTLIGVGLGFISAVCIAIALLQVRQLAKIGENPGAIAFYFALTSSAMSLIVVLTQGWVMPSGIQWLALIGVGLTGGIAQIFMTLSYKYADASALAPYDYLSILWAVIIGFLFFGEVPDVLFWIAVPLIITGAIIAKPRRAKI